MFRPCSCPCKNYGITRSTIWARIGTGYRIENLQKKYFNLAVMLIKQYYFQNDVLLHALGFANDKQSVTYFVKHILQIMKTGSSLLLVDDHNNTIAGVLLLSVVDKLDFGRTFSHTSMHNGKVYDNCISLRNSMQKKIDFFIDYETDVLLRFYLVCIAAEHRGKQLGYHLFRTGLEVARHLHIPIACAVCTSEESKTLATKVGFELVDSVNYDQWFASIEEESFNAPNSRHCVALMVAKVPAFYSSPVTYSAKNNTTDKNKLSKNKNKKK